jgi:hypothetical protein
VRRAAAATLPPHAAAAAPAAPPPPPGSGRRLAAHRSGTVHRNEAVCARQLRLKMSRTKESPVAAGAQQQYTALTQQLEEEKAIDVELERVGREIVAANAAGMAQRVTTSPRGQLPDDSISISAAAQQSGEMVQTQSRRWSGRKPKFKEVVQAAMTASAEEDVKVLKWAEPPPTKDGKPFPVDFRFNVTDVSEVLTKQGTVHIHIGVVFMWADPRLSNWSEANNLPANLWGPSVVLSNAKTIEENQFDFSLVRPWEQTGRLKRVLNFIGTITNPMDLKNFPFDIDDIVIRFFSNSNFESLSGHIKGSKNSGSTYMLRPIYDAPDELHGGKWISMWFDGEISEWRLHGVSTKFQFRPSSTRGLEQSEVFLNFHVSRKSTFFFWKALVPLYLTTLLSMAVFFFPVSDIENRTSTVATYFLAGAAMLYVVADNLPKTDFLTSIDKVIILTIMTLACTGVSCCAVFVAYNNYGAEAATQLNAFLAYGEAAMYIMGNLILLLTPYLSKRGSVQKLSECRIGQSDTIGEQHWCDVCTSCHHAAQGMPALDANYYTLDALFTDSRDFASMSKKTAWQKAGGAVVQGLQAAKGLSAST